MMMMMMIMKTIIKKSIIMVSLDIRPAAYSSAALQTHTIHHERTTARRTEKSRPLGAVMTAAEAGQSCGPRDNSPDLRLA